MNVQVNWLNIPAARYSDAVEPILAQEVSRLQRHFPQNQGSLDVRMRQEGQRYRARVHVQALGRDWWVTGEGVNVVEGLRQAFDLLQRKIGDFKRYSRDHINRRFQRVI